MPPCPQGMEPALRMANMAIAKVRLTVEYDMDLDHVPTGAELAKELRDWIDGNIAVADIQALQNYGEDCSVTIRAMHG